MKKAKLPPFFSRYFKMGGVIDFNLYEEVEAINEAVCLEAISASVPGVARDKLRAISCRHIDDQTFLGDWYDYAQTTLIKRGTWRTADGRTFENPPLSKLEGQRIIGGGCETPTPGSGGQFAYAFSNPPYGLTGSPTEVQRVFEAVKSFLLPTRTTHQILDWSDPRLPEASDYFRAGKEWWGMFLFVVFMADFQRLVVISASTTD